MKEMIYKERAERKLLHSDNYKGFDYYVVSMGTHPCCYVDMTGKKKSFNINEIYCHGGITYCDKGCKDIVEKSHTLIGWDYMHCGDQYGDFLEGKRWTTEELVEECKAVIDQLTQE